MPAISLNSYENYWKRLGFRTTSYYEEIEQKSPFSYLSPKSCRPEQYINTLFITMTLMPGYFAKSDTANLAIDLYSNAPIFSVRYPCIHFVSWQAHNGIRDTSSLRLQQKRTDSMFIQDMSPNIVIEEPADQMVFETRLNKIRMSILTFKLQSPERRFWILEEKTAMNYIYPRWNFCTKK